jgi:alpha-N-acetylglucosaminidase
MASPNVVGVGITPEGIDNNPAYYQLVLDSPWLSNISARQVLLDWGVQRCGRADVPGVLEAYSLLFDTVYRPGAPYLWCCSNPVYCSTALPGEEIAWPAYNTSMLYEAWALMVNASSKCNSTAFDYDMVDIGREYLSMKPCASAFVSVSADIRAAPLTAAVARYMDVANDIDRLLSSHSGFLLGSWLQAARGASELGGNDSTADHFEWNARSQITTWNPVPLPNGMLLCVLRVSMWSVP